MYKRQVSASAVDSGYTLLKEGASGLEVRKLQGRLAELGYYAGGVDGIYGSTTTSAVKAFQRANGLSGDGQAGSQTQTKLYSASAKYAASPVATANPDQTRTLTVGMTGNDVYALQERLIELNYLSGVADGVFGAETQNALTAFQSRNGLTADGIVGKATWYKISYIYVSVKDLSELTSEGETAEGIQSAGGWPGTVLRRGSTGSSVEQVQFWLSDLAQFDSSLVRVSVDGSYGAATERAVRAFQQKQNLTADGVVGQTTWNALYAAWVDAQSDLGGTAWPGTALRRGDTGMEIRLVQFWLRLAADNYSALRTVTVDGSYGAATVSAVTAFQSLFGLTADGVVGRSTWNKLKEVGLAVANKIVAANVAPGQFTATTREGSSGTAVRAVQYYLRRLAAYYSDVPTVTVDGKFGAATTRAVKAWQTRAGLTVDGVVGRLTFQSLYDAALALDTSGPVVRTVSLPAPDAALRPGDTGAEVLRLNRMLLFLSQWIPEINFTAGGTPGSTFDPELEIAVRSAQRYFGLDETGVVTADDWAVFRQAALDLLAASPAGASPKPGGVWPAGALALGSSGPAVLQVQRWLNVVASVDQTADFVPESGQFDAATQAALESYQLTAGLEPLGVVDADTWESLRLATQGLCRECQEG